MSEAQKSPYELMGGEPGVRKLVDRFYDLMDALPETQEIRRMHPEDLRSSRDKLFKFLSGWFGGPGLYVEQYGHPRLRMRHFPFAIGERERDQWMLCMNQAMDEAEVNDFMRTQLKQSFFRMADHMRNIE